MNIRFSFPTLIAAGLLALGAANVHAATNGDLVLVVNRDNGNMSLTGASATVVNLAGYAIGSNRGSIATGSFNGLSDTEADWVSAGIPSASGVQELNSNGDPTAATSVNDTITLDLGTPAYNKAATIASVGFGVDYEQNNFSMTFYDTLDDAVYTGAVVYEGTFSFNNIGITVDMANGTAILKNDSTFNQIITGYLIEAATEDTLNTNLTTFNGLRNETGGSNFQAPGTLDGENLGELDPTGAGIALNAGQSYSLGTIGGTLDDLSFNFLLAGENSSSRVGYVDYINVPTGLDGDYNEDDKVDAADYTVWRDSLGAAAGTLPNDPNSTVIGDDQYNTWKANFGAIPGAGSLTVGAAAVPEPTSAMLVLVGGFAIAACLLGKRQRLSHGVQR